ncbi:MAG: GGDEF domain-containing protein [Proteobacteria bacterium]|nr:GGDEF domain-containing protein [Pseudomonadota bacterium]
MFDVLTASVGVATLHTNRTEPIDKLKNEADKALYNAKLLGRDRVEHIKA